MLMLISLTLAAAASYYINQVFDYETDLINKKLGFLQTNKLTIKEMLYAFVVCAVISVVLAFYLSLFVGLILLIIVVLGYIYSAPPFRLKDRPLSGFLSNAYGIGLLIPFTVMPDFGMNNNGLLGWDNPVYFFFTVGAIYLLTTIPDKEGDEVVGKKTVAVMMPEWIVKLLAFLCLLISIKIAFASHFMILVYISAISAIPVILSFFLKSKLLILFSIKFPIILLTLIAGYFFIGYLVFILALLVLTRIYYKKRFNLIYPKLT